MTPQPATKQPRRSRGGVYSVIPETLTDQQHALALLLTLAAELERDRRAQAVPIEEPNGYTVAMCLAVLAARARRLSRRYAVRNTCDPMLTAYDQRTRYIERSVEGICAALKQAAPSLTLTFTGRDDAEAPALTLTIRERPYALD